jgi:hypothetical protein
VAQDWNRLLTWYLSCDVEKQRHCGPQDYDGDARTWWSDGHAIHSEDMRAGSSSRSSNRDSSNHQQPLALQLWDDRELLQLRDLYVAV